MCLVILRETNRKGRDVTQEYNRKLIAKYPDIAKQPEIKPFEPFSTDELNAFLGILMMAGVHRSNRKHISDLWSPKAVPLYRAAMSRDRFTFLLRCIFFFFF